MNKIKNSSMFLLWIGASISIAEIYTGSVIAPLGISKGVCAILLGHLLGTLLLAFGGYISFSNKRTAMETVQDSLGLIGSKIVAFLNVLQLLGWSAIMIIQGARAISPILSISYKTSLLLVSVIVLIWSYSFFNYSKKVNDICVISLVILCIFMFSKIDLSQSVALSGNLNFTTALELSIAMPVSWLPVIGDFTKNGRTKRGVFTSSFLGYFIGSTSMFILGFFITIFTGKDIIEFMSSIGIIGGLIILLSTVTTTFIDIYSAVISSKQILKIKTENNYIIIYSIIAAVIAFVFPMENYENFLLTIGSIFVPVYSIVFLDYLLKNNKKHSFNVLGIISVLIGMFLFNYFNKISFGIPTLLTILCISIIYTISTKILNSRGVNRGQANM
ncbi:putative hydroxymethylpyrimidine transporter CytX [Haloimpatiens sp. FM7330]|uniref:putative hydroxymethylpyrimidine transporter CytX n=1 Tax=Haloimpatiens sp. FM7330 TaxID=3298610 RepID=UPI003641DCCE